MIEETRVQLDLNGLHKFKQHIDAGTPPGPIADALKQWGVRYRSFVQRRFDRFSKGGGDWPPLALSTILGRRTGSTSKASKKQSVGRVKVKDEYGNVTGQRLKGATRKVKAKTKAGTLKTKTIGIVVSILRNFGLLFAALSPTFTPGSGAEEKIQGLGILVGYGGPTAHGNSKATIADIAAYHNEGSGHLPRRRIIVPPDNTVLTSMASDMQRALAKIAQSDIGGGSA